MFAVQESEDGEQRGGIVDGVDAGDCFETEEG